MSRFGRGKRCQGTDEAGLCLSAVPDAKRGCRNHELIRSQTVGFISEIVKHMARLADELKRLK